MVYSNTQIKTLTMQNFIRTCGGMVPEGDQPSEELISVFENFDSPETMFSWLSERWTSQS